jgi:hypothetical protein
LVGTGALMWLMMGWWGMLFAPSTIIVVWLCIVLLVKRDDE